MDNKELLDEMREKIGFIVYEGRNPGATLLHWNNDQGWIRRSCLTVADQILSLQTESCRIAVVRKVGEIPDPDPHSYEGEFEAMCAIREAAYKAGFVQEVKSEQ